MLLSEGDSRIRPSIQHNDAGAINIAMVQAHRVHSRQSSQGQSTEWNIGEMMSTSRAHRAKATLATLALTALLGLVSSETLVANAAPAAPCGNDILFVGARGSGQDGPGKSGWKPTSADRNGFGSTVQRVYDDLKSQLPASKIIPCLLYTSPSPRDS